MVFKYKYVFPSSVFNLYTREGTYFFAHQYKFHVKIFSWSAFAGRGREKFFFLGPNPLSVPMISNPKTKVLTYKCKFHPRTGHEGPEE